MRKTRRDTTAGAALIGGLGARRRDSDIPEVVPHLDQDEQRVAGVQAAGEHGLQPRDRALPAHHRRLEQRHLAIGSHSAASAAPRLQSSAKEGSEGRFLIRGQRRTEDAGVQWARGRKTR
jgi:hypothetical protein